MIRVLYRHASGKIVGNFPVDQLAAALRDSRTYLWVDLSAATEAEQQKILAEVFRFHPLAIADVSSSLLAPKINDYRQYLFMVLHSIYPGQKRTDLRSSALDIFLGPNFLVTVHEREMTAIEELLADESYHHHSGLGRGPALLLYELISRQLDRYCSLLEEFEAELDRLGDLIFLQQSSRADLLEDLLTAQSSTLRLARVLCPQRDLMKHLAAGDYDVILSDARLYFANVYDRLVNLVGLLEGIQTLVPSTLNIYLALSATRRNDIMRMLTMIVTGLFPLLFLSGLYVRDYPALWLLFLAMALGLLGYFRRIGWL